MVNLEEIKMEQFEGIISQVVEMSLRDFLETPEKVSAFKKGMTKYPRNINTEKERENYRNLRLDSTVLVIYYSVETKDRTYNNKEFLNIPNSVGWSRSKVKAFREKNNLPMKTEEWVNKKIRVELNKDGFLKLLE